MCPSRGSLNVFFEGVFFEGAAMAILVIKSVITSPNLIKSNVQNLLDKNFLFYEL